MLSLEKFFAVQLGVRLTKHIFYKKISYVRVESPALNMYNFTANIDLLRRYIAGTLTAANRGRSSFNFKIFYSILYFYQSYTANTLVR